MHKILVLVHLILGLLTLKLNAQNLVPNYSFENYISCPSAGSNIWQAPPWGDTFNDNIEYYNSCASPCFMSVPCQSSGSFQYAKTGGAFVGFWFLNGYGGNYREYLQVELLDTLENGKCYHIKYYINLHNSIKYAINNFGLYLSNTYHTSNFNGEVLSIFIPQIMNFKNEIINDTLNWVEISGVYTATGGEKFITIGNFMDDANTDTLDTGNGTYPGAYYYIDDVSVIPIDSLPGGMPAYAGVDTNVILGDSVFIGQQISNLNCDWYDSNGVLIANNTSGIYVNPNTSTYYVVEQNLCGTITYDTVTVTVLPTSIEAPKSPKGTFSIYPNPNGGSFTITHLLPNKSNVYLEIIDITGKVVHQEKITTTKQLINIPQLSKGLYFLNFKSEAGELMYSTKMSVVR